MPRPSTRDADAPVSARADARPRDAASTSRETDDADALASARASALLDDATLERAMGATEHRRFALKCRALRFRARRAMESRRDGDDDAARERRAEDAATLEATAAFWRELSSDASSGTRALTALLKLALDGREGAGSDGTRVSSARALARAHRPRDVDEDEALTTEALFRSGDALRARATAQNFGSGFVAGLGGVLTLPIAIPAQLAATTFTSLRLALALAILAGKDPLEPSVAAKAIAAALGSAGSASEELDDVASVGAGVRDGVQYAAIRASGTAMQNASWRLTRAAATKLAQRGAQRGASMAITRAVPIIGGVIGGAVDGVVTQNAGNRAMAAFFPPRPKDCSTIEESIRKSKDEAVANVKNAAETAAKTLNGAFDKISVSLKTSFGKQTDDADGVATPTSAGYQSRELLADDSWERFERERELENMRAVLEDDVAFDDVHADVFSTKSSSTTTTTTTTTKSSLKDADAVERAARDKKKADAWAEFDARWKVFHEDVADATTKVIRYKDIPWPPSTSRALAGCRGKNAAPDATKRAYRKLILRFHPDRFSRFTLHERDRDKIMAKCVAVSAAIQTQYAEATRDSRVAHSA